MIQRIRLRAGAKPSKTLRLGIGDDCAILAPTPGAEVVVTTDFSLENRHFTRSHHSPKAIGHRILARGLSDLAAMGATPMVAFLSLALPRSLATDSRWLDGLLEGFSALAKRTKTPLAGGDTSESPGDFALADIVLLGQAKAGTAMRRTGARVGDSLYVTGSLGGAAAELKDVLAGKKISSRGLHPHLFPEPRLAAGKALRERGLATACMDLSDGVSTDLAHLCEASGVGAEVELALLPLHPLALRKAQPLQLALHGGEDYELLFTARPGTKLPAKLGGVPVTRIGRIVRVRKDQPLVSSVGTDGKREPLLRGGWEHLR
ncbi:MAG: thiamine-phosphate kinase [Acidobacteriaceae bacterium]|nr:thiamine-phosphate kinase [Acidobacteriaceae bacterium]